MDQASLRKYDEWLKVKADEVIRSVKSNGGWSGVFPSQLPVWAHKVRNYLNVEPRTLTRLDAASTKTYMNAVNARVDLMQAWKMIKFMKNHPLYKYMPEVRMMPDPPAGTPDPSVGDTIAEKGALSGDVYQDETGTIWYQMAAGGTIYHFKDPKDPKLEAAKQTVLTQALTPVFKLVSPDKTGGSCETIIFNKFDRLVETPAGTYKVGRFNMGEVNQAVSVEGDIETNTWYQGSYNFSETVVSGMTAHKRHDIDPHEFFHKTGIYLNHTNRHLDLAHRSFPTVDSAGRALAPQEAWSSAWK